jgi:hypothetical protein
MKTWMIVAATLAAGTAYADRLELMTQGAAKSNAGDHGAAITLYEQAYVEDPDPLLLPVIASEYRLAGLAADAIHYYCEYLKKQPKGSQAAYVTSQVIALRDELFQPVAKDRVCEAPKPVRVDFLTPRRERAAKPRMSKREIAGIASGTLGLASLAVSLYYGQRANDVSNELSNHTPSEPWPSDIADIEARGERYEDRQRLFLLAGGAALVTGGILYFTGRSDRVSSETAVIAPTVSPNGAGISFARGF